MAAGQAIAVGSLESGNLVVYRPFGAFPSRGIEVKDSKNNNAKAAKIFGKYYYNMMKILRDLSGQRFPLPLSIFLRSLTVV